MKLSAVAPELQPLIRRMPRAPVTNGFQRRLSRLLIRLLPKVRQEGVTLEIIREGSVSLRLYRPQTLRTTSPLLWIHGGGYMIGTAKQDDRFCGETSAKLGMIVVSAEYRLAPEHSFPAAIDDCFMVWNWLQRSAAVLEIDPTRVVIGGQSAGGGLAAGLVQRLHDSGGIKPLAQWLFCPMLDDRTTTRTDLATLDHFIWNNRLNTIGWRSYLGGGTAEQQIPPYAVPARRHDLHGLPPAWIGVGGIDLFHDECQTYAERLDAAGIDVTLDDVPGAPHAFEALARGTTLATDYVARARRWLQTITA